jgi:methylglutaconyl-CoA hydratase
VSDEARILVETEAAVARVRLDRPEKRNAFDDVMAAELDAAFAGLEAEPDLRAVVLEGAGEVFCAGGDLAWMRRVAGYTREENLRDAAAFQAAFERIDRFPLPVVARIQGAALGGGAGLAAVCDIVVAAADARIGFPEVKLGLVPGVISPYVVRRIGPGHARRLFLTGETFDGYEAQRIGLVHVAAPEKDLDSEVALVLEKLMEVSPPGARACKRLVHELLARPGDALRTAREAIADARASDDGREGTAAFLEKRRPGWLP